MTHICALCADILPPGTDDEICGDCDTSLARLVPQEMAHEINQTIHELEEHLGDTR